MARRAHSQIKMVCDNCGLEVERYPNAKLHYGLDHKICGRLKRVSPQYQQLTLVLDDGREVSYTGPVQVEAQEIEKIRVVEVRISRSKDLPTGCTWDKLL